MRSALPLSLAWALLWAGGCSIDTSLAPGDPHLDAGIPFGSTAGADGTSDAEAPSPVDANSHDKNAAIMVEAESGQRGTNLRLARDDESGLEYLTAVDNLTEPPQSLDDSTVWNVQVHVPSSGEYQLFVRFRIGPGGGTDDSFFVNFGSSESPDWTLINQMAGYDVPGEPGYDPDALVRPYGGNGATGRWKWAVFDPARLVLSEGAHTIHFASREDGLDIDKLALAPVVGEHTLGFTTAQLEQGAPGVLQPPPMGPPADLPPLVAAGAEKFLGMVCCGSQRPFLEAYFNQVTPENAGKWGSVEAERDVYDWTELDQAVQLAQDNGFPFRFHVLLWGSQQPDWIEELPPAEQLEEIRQWFEAVSQRYGERLTYVEVVNEFINQPPNFAHEGKYVEALGGAGQTGFDWVLTAFRMARDTFPPSVRLMLNEYNVVSDDAITDTYVSVVELLQKEALVDAIGVQGHAFSTRRPIEGILSRIGRLGATGLPVMVTEMDVDGPEVQQLVEYQRLFPPLWQSEHIVGITLWGYRPGMWRDDQGATLVHDDGTEKLALRWLRGFLGDSAPRIEGPVVAFTPSDAGPGTAVAAFTGHDASGAAYPPESGLQWGIAGATHGLSMSDNGELRVATPLRAGTHSVSIYAEANASLSALHRLTLYVE